jgi:hypothetical protein
VRYIWQYVVNVNSGLPLKQKKIWVIVLVTKYLVIPQVTLVPPTVFNLVTKEKKIG